MLNQVYVYALLDLLLSVQYVGNDICRLDQYIPYLILHRDAAEYLQTKRPDQHFNLLTNTSIPSRPICIKAFRQNYFLCNKTYACHKCTA